MTTRAYGTERRNTTTVNVDWPGLGNLGNWDKRTGGNSTSEETKIRPAGLPEVALGGVQTAENVVVTRFYKSDRDAALLSLLKDARGKADMSVSMDVLDQHENPTGTQITWTGVLMDVTIHDQDSTSNNPAELALAMSADATVTVLQ